jgi:Ca2+-binding EF-hand superfamily protein
MDSDFVVFFSKFLADVLAMYNKLENIRETLNIDTNIFLDDLYKYFDRNNDMSINIKEFYDKLILLNVSASIEDLKLIFKRYDLEQNLSIR